MHQKRKIPKVVKCPTCGGSKIPNCFVCVPMKVYAVTGKSHMEVCFDCAMDFEVNRCGKQLEHLKGGKR